MGAPPAGWGRSSPACAVTTGGPRLWPGFQFAGTVSRALISIPRHYIEQRPPARQAPAPPDRLTPSPSTSGLKAGPLAATSAAAPPPPQLLTAGSRLLPAGPATGAARMASWHGSNWTGPLTCAIWAGCPPRTAARPLLA